MDGEGGSSSWNGSYDYASMEDPFLTYPIMPILTIIYTLAFLLGLAGNVLVLFVIIRNKSMQTVTNFFLANLAVADLLVVIFCIIPKLLYYILPSWPLGVAVCKLHHYMISATSTASIFILTVISVERFIAILFPLRTRQILTAPHLIVVISFVWISSAAVNIPQLLVNTTQLFNSVIYCAANNNLSVHFFYVYTIISFSVFYTLPLVVMAILYGIISCKLYISTANLHASTETESKETDGKKFWQKIPTKVRYFVNSRGTKCEKSDEQLERSDKSADKKDAGCPDEIQILMETSSPTKDNVPHQSNEHKVGPFLLDEPSQDNLSQHQGNAENGAECIPMTTTANKPVNNKAPKENVDNNMNKVNRTNQDSLPLSHQQKTLQSRSSQKEPKRRKKKNKKEEVLAARKKVIRLLMTIVISFALCLFPVQLVALWTVFGEYPMDMLSAQLAMPLSFWMYFFNSALNPLLYAFLSDNFRRKMRDTLLPKSAARRQAWVRTQTYTRSMMSDNTVTETC